MRTKTSKVVIMLFIALLQCSVAFSATDATTPVPLYYYKYNPPVVDGTNGPRKNPPHQLTLSEQNSVRVNPKATGNKYVLLAANEEGDVATGSINLEGNDGIKAVATPTAKSLEVTLKRPAPTGAMVTVTSVVDGGSKVTSGMPEGAEAITLDVSGLSNGVYVVSYSINSEQIDQKKVNIN